MHRAIKLALAGIAAAAMSQAFAAPVLMSTDWGKEACAAWNKDPILTDKLAESGWAKNDGGKGFKVMQVYREDCKDSPKVELRIALKDGKAMCSYGGAVETAKLNSSHDYVMHAETTRWIEMGKGEYGPTKAMMFGRLLFEGPKMEAMSNMAPFENFLLLVGKVPSETGSCPK
jgi:putative sterol carrier protein